MCPAKKRDSSSPSLFFWLLGAGRPVLIVMLVAGLLGGGWFLAWRKLKPRILTAPEYRVGPEQVEITPLPAWIHSDIRGEVFRDPKLDGPLSIMDDNLIDRIKDAFAQHPWVAKVVSVRKVHPGAAGSVSVKVELDYRRPACMVEVPGKAWAVDAEGVVLPSEDFSPIEATRYLHVLGVDREPTIPAGRRWGDARVVGGAEIAAALGPAWETMKLKQIVPLAADPAAAPSTVGGDSSRRSIEPVFALFTRGGTRIVWGYAPGANVLGELPADVKVARLKQYLAAHDTLDGPQGQAQELDVRTLGLAKPPSR